MRAKIAAFLGSVAGKIIIAGALIIAVLLVLRSCDSRDREAAESKVAEARAEGAANAAKDATGLTANAMEEAGASEQLGRETENEIRNQPGAAVTVDPALDRAAKRRLCLRTVNRDKPGCVAMLGPRPGAATGGH